MSQCQRLGYCPCEGGLAAPDPQGRHALSHTYDPIAPGLRAHAAPQRGRWTSAGIAMPRLGYRPFFCLQQERTLMRVTASTGRYGDVRVLNFSLDQDAAAILDKYAQPRLRARGRFISRLLFEFEAREEERARLRQAVTLALAEPVGVRDE